MLLWVVLISDAGEILMRKNLKFDLPIDPSVVSCRLRPSFDRPVNRQQGSWLRSSRQRYSNRRTAPSNRTVSSPNQMATQAQTYASSWEIEAISYRLAGMSDPGLVTISKWSDKHPISATSMALVTRDGRPTGILYLDWRHSIFALVIFALDSICSLVYIVRFDNGSG